MKYGCVRTGLKHYDAVLNVKYNEIALDLTRMKKILCGELQLSIININNHDCVV